MKRIISVLLAVVLIGTMTACGNDKSISVKDTEQAESIRTVKDCEMTLDFSFGTRTGTYSGEVDDNNIPDGNGTFKSINPDGDKWTYEGDWENGHWNGKGTSTFDSGDKYIGDYVDDYENGQGEYHYSNGDKYIGNFANGQPNGQGEFSFSSGTKYIGNVVNGIASEQGEYYITDRNDQRHFQGKFKDFENAEGYIINGNGSKQSAVIKNGQLTAVAPIVPIEYTLDKEYTMGDVSIKISNEWSVDDKEDKNINFFAEDSSFVMFSMNDYSEALDFQAYINGFELSGYKVDDSETVKISNKYDAIKFGYETEDHHISMISFVVNKRLYAIAVDDKNDTQDTMLSLSVDDVFSSIKVKETAATEKSSKLNNEKVKETVATEKSGKLNNEKVKETTVHKKEETSSDEQNQISSRTVYVTKTGKKYHYSSTCNGGKYYESTLSKAKARGLEPCNKCVN